MYCIDILIEEHNIIKLFISIARRICFDIFDNKKISKKDLKIIVDFCIEYIDNIHHKKEEEILFDEMIKQLGKISEKTIKGGMIIEHNFGRFFVNEISNSKIILETDYTTKNKIKFISNMWTYCDLIERHIEKEDNAIYIFAQKNLSTETLKMLNEKTEKFEKRVKDKKTEYINIINNLYLKYMN